MVSEGFYQGYLRKISNRFKARFDEIFPHWNFDQGNEFEVELCALFSELLPDKYGVCRGFITSKENSTSEEITSDDIIIYDKLTAPILRPPTSYAFTRRENVPIEAVYAYIEAKNTIELKDKSKGTFIGKAIEQVKEVKSLTRKPRTYEEIIDGVILPPGEIQRKDFHPDILNPMFTAIFARGVRINGDLVDEEKDIGKILHLLEQHDELDEVADLVVLGPNIVLIPTRQGKVGEKDIYEYPILKRGRHKLAIEVIDGEAYGIGLVSIILALDRIRLGPVPWIEVVGDAFKRSRNKDIKR